MWASRRLGHFPRPADMSMMGSRRQRDTDRPLVTRATGVGMWLATCLAAAWAVWHATDWGIGLTPDSMVHLGTARRWVEQFQLAPLLGPSSGDSSGIGPLYPLALTIGSAMTQADPMLVARWLGTIILPVNLVLIGWLLRRTMPQSTCLPWLGALLVATNVAILTAHTTAATEPPFLALLTLSILGLDAYLVRHSPVRYLALLVLLAMACFARSAGISLIWTAQLAILLLARRPFRARLFGAAFVAVAWLPTVAWARVHPNFAFFGFHMPKPSWIVGGWMTLQGWATPAVGSSLGSLMRAGLTLAWLAACVFLAAGWWTAREQQGRDIRGHVPAILALFSGCYVLLLVLNGLFWDADTPLDERILSPLWLSFMLLVVIGMRRRMSEPGTRMRSVTTGARAAAFTLGLAWLGLTLIAAAHWIRVTHWAGQGYNSRTWKQAPILAAVTALSPDTYLASNGPDAIVAVTGRRAVRVPEKASSSLALPNFSYARDVELLRRRLLESNGAVVFLSRVTWRWYLPSEADLVRDLDLQEVLRVGDGAIYRVLRDSDARRH